MREAFSGAEIIIRCLEDLGVKDVFGYSGGAILPVLQALGRSGLRLTVTANEQAAGLAAAGFSRASGSVGVAIVTSGPAVTNALTAVADAYGDSVPLIVIAGQVPAHRIGTDAFQHIDVRSIFRCVTKRTVLLKRAEELEAVLKDAYYLSLGGKPGPVVLDVPKDVQLAQASYERLPCSLFAELYRSSGALSDEECARFFELLQDSSKPLLYVGGGLVAANGALRSFNERFRIPYVNTLMGKGVLPEACGLGMLGMFGTPEANTIIQECDFFFALGVRWDDRVAEKVGKFALQAKIAYIDIHEEKVREIVRERRPQFTYVGDAGAALKRLLAYADEHDTKLSIGGWRAQAARIKRSFVRSFPLEGQLHQSEVLCLLDGLLGDDVIVTTGVGNHQMFAAQLLKMHRPRRFLTSGSFGTMGFALPTAIGACKASPHSTVIVIDGDGGLKMNFGELCTIGANALPIKVLVLNNLADGMVRNLEATVYEGSYVGTQRPADIPFARVARVCGFSFSRRISAREELAGVLSEFLSASGPALLEVMTDPDEAVYPLVRPGDAYKDMDLGPWIRWREASR